MAETSEVVSAPVDSEPSFGMFKKRGARAKGNARRRLATPPQARSDDSSEEYSSEDESGRSIKRRKKNTGIVTGTSANYKSSGKDLSASTFDADRNASITSSNNATKQSNWYEQESNDALKSKSLLGSTRAMAKDPELPDGTYRGLSNQTSFIQRNPNAPTRAVGPVKAPTNVRTTTQTDYAPDVCKDYKQTGFCGFGDSCKFLHDRSDYKQGWQLDKEWESVTKGKKLQGTVVASANKNKGEEEDEDEEALLESIPFACIICKGDYKYPIITKCGHYFCENCALQRYRKDPSCAACGQGTNGVFNNAKKLKKLLERKRERELANGEESDEDGDDEDA